MAFTIKIFEKDEYIYSLLKSRLGQIYKDAYIVNPMTGDNPDMSGGISEYTVTYYDQRFIDRDELGIDDAMPLVDQTGTINCKRIQSTIEGNTRSSGIVTEIYSEGTCIALIPFVDTVTREAFIKKLKSSDLSYTSHTLRIDLTVGLRASPDLSRDAGCLTELIRASCGRNFMPEDILDYCTLDISGFLTPGSCKDSDDILDCDHRTLSKLAMECSTLAHTPANDISCLIVIDGIRSKGIPDIASTCDKAILLCPGGAKEAPLYKDLADSISKYMEQGSASIVFTDPGGKDGDYEQIV
ncbi:MAG: hypothetical protein K5745_07460 [Saccharofermentans sp.]|nr:hypothetical protein [Saccharofermentans sp.]